MISEHKLDTLMNKYFIDEADGDIPMDGAPQGNTPPPMGGGIPDMGMNQQQQQSNGSDTPPGDPVGAAKFSKLFAAITAPNGGFLPTVIGKYSTKYTNLTTQINNKLKQLQSLKGEIDILLGNLSKNVAKDNSNQATEDNED